MRSDTKRLGRPPAYDRDHAIKVITNLFWQKGFATTSLDDIARATGMNRPSLYAAFGDKRAMYQLALHTFAAEAARHMAEALSRSRLRDALSEFYDQAIALYTCGVQARGCLIACSGAHVAANDGEVQDIILLIFEEIDGLLKARFQTAYTSGQLHGDVKAEDRAILASAILHGIAVQARAGLDETSLREQATAAVRALSA